MRALLIVLSHPSREPWVNDLMPLVSQNNPLVIYATPADAARQLAAANVTPSHILLDIGNRGQDVLAEIDILAQQCEAGTRVLAVGDTNDIILYRGLVSRGVVDYLPMPVAPSEVLRLLTAPPAAAAAPAMAPAAQASTGKKRVVAFLSAASGDGASVAAMNTAYAISQLNVGSTVLVDMDYQFGMVAKNLNLQNQYGIGDLFDHPDRGLDATLIKRMVATYGNLHVITAPADLRYMPNVSAEAIHGLIATLKMSYDNVVLDLPHALVPWISACLKESTHVIVVAQLWLKSVSHAARFMKVLRDAGVPNEIVHMVINRSGARFKEAIEPRDFGRVCGSPIKYTLTNDIKAVVNAEGAARTIIETGPSELATDIQNMARSICGVEVAQPAQAARSGGLFSKLKV
jgi:pilus assembly protein CpaE